MLQALNNYTPQTNKYFNFVQNCSTYEEKFITNRIELHDITEKYTRL